MLLETDPPELATDSRLRLQTSVRLRWFAVVGQLITVALVSLWLGFAMPLGYCLALIVLSAPCVIESLLPRLVPNWLRVCHVLDILLLKLCIALWDCVWASRAISCCAEAS